MNAEAPAHVGVLGGGRMGAGIAHAFLLAGSHVTVVERDEDAARAASDRVLDSVQASIARGSAREGSDAYRARFTATTEIAAFAGCALVVEAVPEDIAMKIDALTRLEAHVADDAAIASNTSSISIDELAATLEHPARFLGMHFFNPVPASSLVEIVRGATTAPLLIESARRWVQAIDKTPIVVADSPGFASSRLGVALGLEAIRMVEEGVASPDDIDAAMTLGYKHPVGPLRLTDIVGLDVRLGIAEYLAAHLGERFEPPALLRRLVAEGNLGRKTGRGFYEWDA
ncbi:3-hydroxyacyl-CoA dehydrogenase family protein [Microbacterium hydrocarbonoxydans]|uniref:3-hydroxyacyl-CoA dehydrogenase family protein n=1 Tax=Microbacterium hydrocarbonoxydans TaxID=273678 RepID=UPI00203BA309|nr:3-hydroxyacyl-CoA dehydrogenase family protein [Microbacterium hydrocarbonoxydans]MCM3779504.1 3-hydroxyacyl-CoA dehydrogenase family protein [Microbacterium hydrocarbonoxydans]